VQAVEEKDRIISKLESEKFYLGEKIFQLTGVEESFWNDETLVSASSSLTSSPCSTGTQKLGFCPTRSIVVELKNLPVFRWGH
jgi:hypothetical protein